jgi:hypothetical protein
MNLQDFARIHKEAGYKVNILDGIYFLNRRWIAYSFPQLYDVNIEKHLINMLKWRKLITVIKTTSRIKNTYEYILKTNNYHLDTFRKKTRTTIKKSLKYCEFKMPLLNDLLTSGLAINRETLKLQYRKDKFISEPHFWNKLIRSFYDNTDAKILGAYFNKKLIAYAVAYFLEGKHFFFLQHIDRQYATYYPMSGLMYILINEIIAENGKIEISDGVESFTPIPSLNRFKRFMGFERVPVTRIYILHPVLLIVLKPVVFYFIRIKKLHNIKNPNIRKIVDLYYGHRILTRVIV